MTVPANHSAGGAQWGFLKPGDTIDVIAPSSAPGDPAGTIAAIEAYFAGTD
jgi:hypothetical protein